MKLKTRIIGTLAAGLALGCGSLMADYDQLLDTMAKNGFITEKQAAAMKGTANEEKVAVTTKSSDTKGLAIRGRAQFQFGYVSPDSDIPGTPTNDYSTFELRRLRIGTQGDLYQNLKFDIRISALPEGADLNYATLVYTGLEGMEIGVGKNDMTLSMEDAVSSTAIITVERSYASNLFDPPKSVGVWAEGETGPFGLFLGAFNGENENDNPLDSDDDSHLAFNFRAGFDASGSLPDGIGAGVFFDTVQNQDNDSPGAYPFESSYSLGAEIEAGPFGLMGNILWGTLTENDNNVTGFVVMPWLYLTEKLQIVARYDYLESDKPEGIGVPSRYIGRAAIGDSPAALGDKWESVYAGANYYISGNNLKVMSGLEWSELTQSGITAVDAITLYGALRMRF